MQLKLLTMQVEKLCLEIAELREQQANSRASYQSRSRTKDDKRRKSDKPTPTSTTAGIDVPRVSHRLCVVDINTRERFLVDTGAEISVLAVRNKRNVQSTPDYQLYAANNTRIATYGERTLELNLGLRRSFRWTFVVADVKTSILGADFLRSNKLIVDLHRHKLLDQVTEMDINAFEINNHDLAVYLVNRDHAYHDLLMKYPDVLRPMSLKTPPKHSVTHHIETTGPPLYARPRPLPPDKYKAAKLEFEKMIDMGICRPSKSSWASPLHVVKKKDGSLRVCGDYRRLNAVTVPDRYPIPRIQDFTYQLHGKKVFSKLDIKSAYYWIPNKKEDAEKTAIITPFGLFEFTCMTFGLRNSGQTFQRFMHEVLRGLDDNVFCFVDDILIHSKNQEENRRHVEEVLKRLDKYGISINIDKCEFGKEKIHFLGYEVSSKGIRPTEDRIEAIKKYPKPKTIQELRQWLGMVNFYRDCLPHQAEHQYELNKYLHNTKKNDKTPIQWTPEADRAFEKCRQSIIEATTLTHPVPKAPLCLLTDASDRSLGAVLQQKVNNTWRPLAFFSKSMSDTQRRYSVYDRELLAMYTAVRHMRRLIEGNEVTIYTDHKPLSYALTKPPTSSDTPRRERQLHFISQFCSNIKYIDGSRNQAADAMSRLDMIEEIQLSSSINFNKIAEDQTKDEELKSLRNKQNLKFVTIKPPGVSRAVTCESSTGYLRPYLPTAYRYAAFKAQHDLSHPGIRATRKIMTSKFFWPSINKDVGIWTKSCIGCQRAKIYRHVTSPLGKFPESRRWEHIDIVGPLTISNDFRYIVTIIDRCTRWPEAIPIHDITAETVAKAVYEGWITRFGCPLRVTTDRGLQFTSSIFGTLMKKFGIEHIRTTAYHPIANGKIERWHRTLKAALMAKGAGTRWSEILPTVLLGLRISLCADTNFSPALMTYGSTLRVPSDFFLPTKSNIEDAEFVRRLTETMASLAPTQRRATREQPFVYKDLATCSHVFVRNDTVRSPLKPPYDGPYHVLERYDKYFKLQYPLRTSNVSIDRLKPAYVLNEDTERENRESSPPCQTAPKTASASPASNDGSAKPYVTRSGRTVKKNAGGRVVFATDDFFAPCECMLSDTEPIFIPDKYTEFGKWMDGWETRRKRIPGHDWCIIKLAAKCVIKGLLVDTAFFTGNNAPKYSIQAAHLTPEEEKSMPLRVSCIGSACTECEMKQIQEINSDQWDEILPVTDLRPGYEETRFNFQKVLSDEAWTHIRVNIYPDGGIARLRVYGEARPETPRPHDVIDLVSLLNGATCLGYSNAHYGHPKNMIKPCKSLSMADGWETARRSDRPEVIEANEDGTLKVPGQEWAVFKLGFPGKISQICVDTAHFKGNYPDTVKIEGAYLGRGTWNGEFHDIRWQNILRPSKLSAHADHWFQCTSDVVTHIRVIMAPDGGISRIRAFGTVEY